MSTKLGIIIDPLHTIRIKKDTSYALLKSAQARGYSILYATSQDIWLEKGQVFGNLSSLTLRDDPERWFEEGPQHKMLLSELDVLLLRKDPPFNMDYIYMTYLLELAAAQGLLVVNNPASVRSANEKLFTAWFPECCPDTLVTTKPDKLQAFVADKKEAVIKPLDGMGGNSVFLAKAGDPNLSVIIETMTHRGSQLVMAQQFIPEIAKGDKRIILINGTPIPYVLSRVPAAHDFRGNLAAGAKGIVQPLSERDQWIAERVGPTLSGKGLWFVGLDVIGNYLTEINVTSPTGVQEIEREAPVHITEQFFDFIEEKLNA
jgi:glutathione synthase